MTTTGTIATLTAQYRPHGATTRQVRALAATLAVNHAVHLGADHDPLPDEVYDELIGELDEQAADTGVDASERQAAYGDSVLAAGGYLP